METSLPDHLNLQLELRREKAKVKAVPRETIGPAGSRIKNLNRDEETACGKNKARRKDQGSKKVTNLGTLKKDRGQRHPLRNMTSVII